MQDVFSRFAREGIRFAHPNRLVTVVEGTDNTS